MKQGKNMLTSTLLHKYKLTLVAASVTFLFACAGPDNQTENKQARRRYCIRRDSAAAAGVE